MKNHLPALGFAHTRLDPRGARPAATGASPNAHANHARAAPTLSLDDLIAKARAAGVRGTIELRPQPHGAPVNIRDDHPRAPDEVWLQLDARSGAVLTKVVWQDFLLLAKLVSLGVDLHEGSFFGRANQVFNTIVAGGGRTAVSAVRSACDRHRVRPDLGLLAVHLISPCWASQA